ncbi:MAG: vitamin K epoxide reductase family protein [Planctomycetota bacterium]
MNLTQDETDAPDVDLPDRPSWFRWRAGNGAFPVRGEFPARKTVCLIALVSIVAFSASSYLAFVAFTSSKVAGCGSGKLFNCGHVISSRWSLWFGIPVSVLAASLYVGLVAALCVAVSKKVSQSARSLAWMTVSVLALSAGMAAIWFVSLQIFDLGHLCTYCLVAHGCGLVAAITIWIMKPNGSNGFKFTAVLAGLGFAVLVGVQLASEDPATYRIETYDSPVNSSDPVEFEVPVFDAPDGTF